MGARARALVGAEVDWVSYGAVLAMSVPLAVALVRASSTNWYPTGDVALEALRMDDVGTSLTPLVGVYSRFGWSHPGPLLFWAGAPLHALAGPRGLLILAGLLNLGSAIAAGLAARRVGGRTFTSIVALGTLVLLANAGPEAWINPWNPFIAMFPLLAFLLSAAAAACGARWALFMAVATGSFAAQAHLGSVPVVVAASALALAWCRVRRRQGASPPFARSSVALALGLLVLLWSGPLLDIAVNWPGNAADIASWVVEGSEAPPGLDQSLAVADTELGIVPAWVSGDETIGESSFIREGQPWQLGCVGLALAVGTVLAWRRGAGHHALLAAYSGGTWLIAVLAMTRTVGGYFPYVVRWSWPVGVLVAATLASMAIRGLRAMVAHRRPGRGRLPPALAAGAAAALLLASVVVVVGTSGEATVPFAVQSRGVAGLTRTLEASVPDGPFAYTWIDRYDLGSIPLGAAVELLRRGHEVELPVTLEDKFGESRVGPGTGLPQVIVVAEHSAAGWTAPPGARRVATYDMLTAEQRVDLDAAEDRIGADLGAPDEVISARSPAESQALVDRGADPRDPEVARALQALGDRYDVWLVPPR